MPINGTLMRTLRAQRGLSPVQAAALAGITRPVLLRIESNDEHAARMLTVDGLTNLADALGTRPGELLNQTPTANGAQTTSTSSDRDPRVLLGLLHDHRDQTTRRALADALGWTSQQVKDAVEDLNLRLDGTGLAIHQRDDMLQLVPTETNAVDQATTRLAVNQQTRRGMNITVAKTLRRVWNGQLNGGRNGKQTIIALAQLKKTGVITQTGPETYTPSDALRYALNV